MQSVCLCMRARARACVSEWVLKAWPPIRAWSAGTSAGNEETTCLLSSLSAVCLVIMPKCVDRPLMCMGTLLVYLQTMQNTSISDLLNCLQTAHSCEQDLRITQRKLIKIQSIPSKKHSLQCKKYISKSILYQLTPPQKKKKTPKQGMKRNAFINLYFDNKTSNGMWI